MKHDSLIILSSYHHKNTEKIANVIAKTLSARIIEAQDVNVNDIAKYDLIGFGSGIYDGHHHNVQLDLAIKLPTLKNKKAFIFSTTGAPKFIANEEFMRNNHSKMREILESKGYDIVGEFECRGWNTNNFLKHFGGLNKTHPNENDLNSARVFANSLVQKW
jgi:flavodoxin